MDLVKRIEVIRGPSSSLYGSNGIFATINIVTKFPVEQRLARVSTETGSFGEKKLMVSSSSHLGRGANLLVSASAFHTGGPSLYLAEYDTPDSNHGRAVGMDGERGYHTFANLVWGGWSLAALVNNREKQTPVSWGDFVFNDAGNRIWDARNFLGATYTRQVGLNGKLQWQLYYDWYEYRGSYRHQPDQVVEDNRDLARGDWINSRLTYQFPLRGFGQITLGGEVSVDLRALQLNADVFPESCQRLNVSSPDRSYAAFLQQERRISRRWKAYLGIRVDESAHNAPFLSPRLAAIHQRSPTTTFKFLYGRAFRNPNAFEQFYDHYLIMKPNPAAWPEHADTFETVVERKLNGRWEAVATAYHYRLGGLLESVWLEEGLMQYQNVAQLRATGAELELQGKPWRALEATASLAAQKVHKPGASTGLVNSPAMVAKLRLATPLGKRMWLSAHAIHLSRRKTFEESDVPSVHLWDLTFSSRALHPNFDFQFGLRNLLGRRYFDPIGLNPRLEMMPQDGRTVFVKLIWRTQE